MQGDCTAAIVVNQEESLTVQRVEELRRLAESKGDLLLPEEVVDAARPPQSVLHGAFIWDDSIAGERYRIEQARALLRVRVRYETSHGESHVIPAFTSLNRDRFTGGYRDTRAVLDNAELRREMLATAKRELRSLAARYRRFVELAKVLDAIDTMD